MAGNGEWGMGSGQSHSALPHTLRGACFTHSPFPIPHSRRRASRAAQGFTLIEVIAAIALLGIAFTVLMQVAGGGLRLTQKAAQRSEATLWARSKLDSAFVLEPIRAGSSSGHFNRQFRWQLQVSRFNPSGATRPDAGSSPIASPLQLYRLDLDVLWGSPGHSNSAHFSTLRLVSADNGPS